MGSAASGISGIAGKAGIGLRHPHYRDMLARRPPLAFLEVHSENYFGAGGPPHFYLEQLRRDYPLSLHGVGMSLGSDDPLDSGHLAKLKLLVERYQPALVSDHLCWTSAGGIHANDLLPLPFTREAARRVASKIMQAQDFLGRRMLVENASAYVAFAGSEMTEWEFVNEVVETADCLLLFDVNNVYVNAVNHGFDPLDYVNAMPAGRIAEYHLAGYDLDERADCLVDTHGKPVYPQVWELFNETVARLGPKPTLIEWDADIPPLDTLLAEAAKADAILEQAHVLAA